MFKRHIKLNLALFFLLLITIPRVEASNADVTTTSISKIEVSDIKVTPSEQQTDIFIQTNTPSTAFTSNTVDGTDTTPARMYIDIENAELKGVPDQLFVGTTLDKIRIAKNKTGVRIVFDSSIPSLFEYNINSVENGINIVIKNAEISAKTQDAPIEPSNQIATDNTLDALIESSVAEVEKNPVESATQNSADKTTNAFEISGFKKEKISVDFYKIDLHNVFRLFREISGLNIIVDENVKGSLTLSLNDVPWDFALDIILNLTDLKKEERYNTIVIYPMKKAFSWPERTSLDNLEIETDLEVLEQETLIVQQSANQPKEIMLAQEALREAKAEEKRGDFEDAAVLYEKAFKLWPTNSKIANRLATLYLVNLRINAKAVYFANESLNLDPSNSKAALYAAIGSANMQQKTEAMEYFNQSVSGNPPMKEALISYAAFSETNKNLISALKLLDKYSSFYGDTANTMLSKARIYDKQGDSDKATAQYAALMSSGFQIRPDLKKFIRGRLAAGKI